MLKRNKPLVRKTPLKRSTKPIARNTPIKRSTKPIAKKSDTQKQRDKKYYPARKEYLDEHTECELKISPECTGLATEIHHAEGTIGDLYWDKKKFKGTCRPCHIWAENNREKAIELGFSLKRVK